MDKPKVIYENLGLISYKEAWDYQTKLQKEIIQTKREGESIPTSHLLLCEHRPVYTLGKSGSVENLVMSPKELAINDIEYFKTNRGGDITYHGPGQITGYPILDLDQYYNDLHRYVRELEQVIINVLEYYDIRGDRIEGFTGVWLPKTKSKPINRKICAIGVHMSRWVSMHGFALNVKPDLDHFNGIIPCGINEDSKTVTSLSEELQKTVDIQEVKSYLQIEFQKVFGFEYVN